MKFGEFMAKLNRKPLKHVYLLAGEEDYYVERAKVRLTELLSADGSCSTQKFDSVPDTDKLIAVASEVPFFTEKNILEVRDSSLFKDNKSAIVASQGKSDKRTERLIKFFASIPETSYIIFVSNGKIDKRRKLVKAIDKYGDMLEADRLRSWEINDFLLGKLQALNKEFTPDATAYFAEVVSLMQPISLSFLSNELDKLALFAVARRIDKATLAESMSGIPEVSQGCQDSVDDSVPPRKGRRISAASCGSNSQPNTQITANQIVAKKRVAQCGVGKEIGCAPFYSGKTDESRGNFFC